MRQVNAFCDLEGDDPVRVMSQEEQATYHGVTINDKVNEQAEQPYMHIHNVSKGFCKNCQYGTFKLGNKIGYSAGCNGNCGFCFVGSFTGSFNRYRYRYCGLADIDVYSWI